MSDEIGAGLNGQLRRMTRGCKDSEYQTMCDQQERDYESWNEIGSAQLARREPGMIGLIERVEQVGRPPEVEEPHDCDASRASQRCQR